MQAAFAIIRGERRIFYRFWCQIMSAVDVSLLLMFLALPGLFLLAGIYDVLTTRIPDWISILLIVFFCLYAWVQSFTWTNFGLHWGVAFIVFVAGFVAFTFRWMGGGDGKLASAGALWFGPDLAPSFIILSFMFGGLLVLAVYMMRSITLPNIVQQQSWLMRWIKGGEGLPFGLAMAGAVFALLYIEH